MKQVPPVVRFLIVAAIFVFYLLALVQWAWFDGLIRSFFPAAFLIAFVVGTLCAGITYGVLPVKKTVEQSKVAYADKKTRQAVIGYWTWIFIWGIFFCLWMFVRIYDL
jgi:hypothetical protein